VQPYVVNDGLFPMKRTSFQETANGLPAAGGSFGLGVAPGLTTTLESRGLGGHFCPFMRFALPIGGVPDGDPASPFNFLS
jgi:hypothetical protein